MPRPHQSRTMYGRCSTGSVSSARLASRPMLLGGSMTTAFSSSSAKGRYGHDPGFSFYTHLSDQHRPYSIKVMSATNHEASYVLDGLLHHGTLLKIDTHYTDTGGTSDHVFILCALLGFRFCPRLRDLPERKLACITPAATYPYLQPLLGQRIKTDVIREHRGEIIRLVASLKAGIVAPSSMLRKLAAYRPRTSSTWRCKSWGGSNARCSCSTGSKAQNCAGAAMPDLTRASSVIRSRRSSALSNKAGSPTASPRRSNFVPPALTSSSPRSCSGIPPTSP